MNPRARRVLYIVTAGALLSRLFVLGHERGFALVGRATLTVTFASLASWLVHMTFHELGHWATARWQGFVVRAVRFGPVRFDLTGPRPKLALGGDLGGGITSLPRGAHALARRLRLVALAGPLVTLGLTALAFAAWHVREEPSLATPLGIFLVMGGFTLVTSLLPGALLPRRPESGTDLEQLLLPRAVLAHWTNAAAVQALLDGKRVAEALDWRTTRALLPLGGETEPFELAWSVACLDAGQPAIAKDRLRVAIDRLDDVAPEWLALDLYAQWGALSALEGDVPHAQACLGEVQQRLPYAWYPWLLEACIAKARGEPWRPLRDRWLAAAAQHHLKSIPLSGCGWILDALGQ